MNIRLSGVVTTFNEEEKLWRCLSSLNEVADEIVVVDSFSTDGTVTIAREFGARVIQREFVGQIDQKNFAVAAARFDHVLSLDADECLSEELITAIKNVKSNFAADGYYMNRLSNFCGKTLRYSWYPDKKIRLWDRRKAIYGGENPHEKVFLPRKKTKRLKGDILHDAFNSFREPFAQAPVYAEIAAQAKFRKGKKANILVNIILSPLFKFVRLYIFHLGFLDGFHGFVYCVNAGVVNFMKYSRLRELGKHADRKDRSPEKRIKSLDIFVPHEEIES